ncbi:MAG: quinone-dependent dihydroorotate dehydrogenase [Myxococcales bacterium]
MYRLIFERLLSKLDAEAMHKLGFGVLRLALGLRFLRTWLRSWLVPDEPSLRVRALGREFDSPLGLAAGFDKDAVGFEALYALGFGFIEIGTLTGQPQPGNPRPRMFRLVRDRALINRLGFNNGGSADAVARLSAPRSVPLGVNIGKTKLVPEEQAVEDYRLSAERLGRLADYMVVNVSSPNTPGLRNLQAVELLRPLLSGVRQALDRVSEGKHVPLLVKIAPDLADEDVDAVADLALELKLDGVIATNTTISRAGLDTDPARVAEIGAGGLSGEPVRARSLAVLRRLRARVGERVLLIGVGGIGSAEDVLERILAGATLVQAYTGFVYGGPLWPSRVRSELARLLRARGFASVQAAVGAGVVQAANQKS